MFLTVLVMSDVWYDLWILYKNIYMKMLTLSEQRFEQFIKQILSVYSHTAHDFIRKAA